MIKNVFLIIIWVFVTIAFWNFDAWLISQPSDFLVIIGFLMLIAYAYLSAVTKCFWIFGNKFGDKKEEEKDSNSTQLY